MDILYLLIPLSALLVLAIIGIFGWALTRGQFEDLEHEGERILHDDPPDAAAPDRPASFSRDVRRESGGPVGNDPGSDRAPRVDDDQAGR